MRLGTRPLLLPVICSIVFCLGGCEASQDSQAIESSSQMLISAANVEKIIAAGRAQIGTVGGQCKPWVSSIVRSAYSKTIPSTAAGDYQWDLSSSPNVVFQTAQWLGSYANGRVGPLNLSAGQSNVSTFNVSINDPQIIVLYASAGNVTATITKSGSTTLSVTTQSTSPGVGIVSSSVTYGTGTWTLTVTNNRTTAVTGVVAVVLSQSRIQSDWQTARRGDMIQMAVGLQNRAVETPHTTFVQTDYNTNGDSSTCGTSNTTGCNWLDSNSDEQGHVFARNRSFNDFITSVAYSSSYGFTIYRLY